MILHLVMTNLEMLEELKKLKAIADIGLLYCQNEYDRERYTELQDSSLKLLGHVTGQSPEDIKVQFPLQKDYPTAKVDIRGLVLSADKKILMVKESLDGKWSLPGGWADIGCSPKETVIKECREETGLDVVPKALVAVFDKRFHPHPPQAFYVYKMVFYCEPTSFAIQKGFDVLDARYFDFDDLPELSEDRILKSQIEIVYQKVLSSDFQAYVD